MSCHGTGLSDCAQVLRETQARMQQAPPPPGSSSPQKDSGLGTTGNATRKEFEVSLCPAHLWVLHMAIHGPYLRLLGRHYRNVWHGWMDG